MDIKLINDVYNQHQLDFKNLGNEESIIDLLLRQKKWNILDDEQKNVKRKYYLEDFKKYFLYDKKQQKIFQYENLVFLLTLGINNFLKSCHIDFTTSNEFLFRIKSMLFCEKEFIFQYEKFNRIGHVPYEIFEPLIEKVKDTEEYKLYKLDELFETYKKMYDLFLEKPYKNA